MSVQIHSNSIPSMLYTKPFFKEKNYHKVMRNEMNQRKALAPSYITDTETKVARIAKLIFSIIIFPIGLYRLIHVLLGKIIVPSTAAFNLPAATKDLAKIRLSNFDKVSSELKAKDAWKLKRFTIEVNGTKIDALMICRPSTLEKRRWVLHSPGNGSVYEDFMSVALEKENLFDKLEANALFFNYPGVAGSTGSLTRKSVAEAHKAMLRLLEDKENGIGAETIVSIGHSFGGVAQAEALKTHTLKNDIQYVFVKDRTLGSLAEVAHRMVSDLKQNVREDRYILRKFIDVVAAICKVIVRVFGWNVGVAEASRKLKAPEIILQSMDTLKIERHSTILKNRDEIAEHDEVFARPDTLAYHLLASEKPIKDTKLFIGTAQTHNGFTPSHKLLAKNILSMAKKPR